MLGSADREFNRRNPRCKTYHSAIEKFKETGSISKVFVAGLSIVQIEHDFVKTEGGTRFEHRLITSGMNLVVLFKASERVMFLKAK